MVQAIFLEYFGCLFVIFFLLKRFFDVFFLSFFRLILAIVILICIANGAKLSFASVFKFLFLRISGLSPNFCLLALNASLVFC